MSWIPEAFSEHLSQSVDMRNEGQGLKVDFATQPLKFARHVVKSKAVRKGSNCYNSITELTMKKLKDKFIYTKPVKIYKKQRQCINKNELAHVDKLELN